MLHDVRACMRIMLFYALTSAIEMNSDNTRAETLVQIDRGQWDIEACFLLCGHACAIKVEKQAVVRVKGCRCGALPFLSRS